MGRHHVVVMVTDRIGHGTTIDLRPEAARVLMGKHFRKVGRLWGVRVREVEQKKKIGRATS